MTSPLRTALAAPSSSDRLQAALWAGTTPNPEFVEALVERCRIEPDFSVRDMLTWALTRHPAELTVPLLLDEITTRDGQARSQALHSLSKIRDPRGWEAITPELLSDPDDTVARTAWRAAVVLVPDGGEDRLARQLGAELGRGVREVQASLSRAITDLGIAAELTLAIAANDEIPVVRIHAIATQRLLDDPDEGFDAAYFEAQRIVELGPAP